MNLLYCSENAKLVHVQLTCSKELYIKLNTVLNVVWFFLKIGFRDGQNIKLSFCIHVFLL